MRSPKFIPVINIAFSGINGNVGARFWEWVLTFVTLSSNNVSPFVKRAAGYGRFRDGNRDGNFPNVDHNEIENSLMPDVHFKY